MKTNFQLNYWQGVTIFRFKVSKNYSVFNSEEKRQRI